MRVALLMDAPLSRSYAAATIEALDHAAAALGCSLDLRHLATDAAGDALESDGVVIGPGSPYRDEQAVWDVVRSARERGVPLVGT